jgi:hypothetical protein
LLKGKGEGLPVEVITVVLPIPRSDQQGTDGFHINRIHKQKDQKVQPVDDLGQTPRDIEGRLDWKERAAAQQFLTNNLTIT